MDKITRQEVLDDLDIRTKPDGRKRIFSMKFIDKSGKIRFVPQAFSCGAGRMNMKLFRVRGIHPCDCKGNPEGHIVPVEIYSIIQYNGKEVTGNLE